MKTIMTNNPLTDSEEFIQLIGSTNALQDIALDRVYNQLTHLLEELRNNFIAENRKLGRRTFTDEQNLYLHGARDVIALLRPHNRIRNA